MTAKTGFGAEPGLPVINNEECTKCGICIDMCCTGSLELADGMIRVKPGIKMDCVACGQCMMVCPRGCITVTGRNLSSADLVDLPSKESVSTFDQLYSLYLSRRSIRSFNEREVEKEVIERIVEATTTAPMGLPPSDVEVLIFAGRPKVAELRNDLLGFFKQSKKVLTPFLCKIMRPFLGRVLAEQMRTFIIPVMNGVLEATKNNHDMLFFDAPVVLAFHASPYADSSDCPIACTYAMLAAQALGLGNIMLGLAPNFLGRSKKLRQKYGIPDGNIMTIMLALGYTNKHFQHGIKRRLASVRYA